MKEKQFDICIIGAGPAGLASLSGVREPYPLDDVENTQVNRTIHSLRLHRRLKVCVVDPHEGWLHGWKKNREALDVEFLRSPIFAHPHAFDRDALLAYAVANDRTEELDWGRGAEDDETAGRRPMELWTLPSTRLFVDFCEHLSDQLPHDYVRGKVTRITRNSSESWAHSWF